MRTQLFVSHSFTTAVARKKTASNGTGLWRPANAHHRWGIHSFTTAKVWKKNTSHENGHWWPAVHTNV